MRKFFSGRIGRGEFLLGIVTTAILLSLGLYIARSTENIVKLVFIVPVIFLVTFQYSLLARRLHDLGKSGWWSLVNLIPVINIAFLAYLVFAKGENGKNRYGKKSPSMMI